MARRENSTKSNSDHYHWQRLEQVKLERPDGHAYADIIWSSPRAATVSAAPMSDEPPVPTHTQEQIFVLKLLASPNFHNHLLLLL